MLGLVLAAVFGYVVWRAYQTRVDFERGSQEPLMPPRRKPARKRKRKKAASPDAVESPAEEKAVNEEPDDAETH